jgi:uncharacterized membrane protein YhaH (DUF805 family)
VKLPFTKMVDYRQAIVYHWVLAAYLVVVPQATTALTVMELRAYNMQALEKLLFMLMVIIVTTEQNLAHLAR